MLLGSIVTVPLLSALMLAPTATIAQTANSASSASGTALSQHFPAANAGTAGVAAKTEAAGSSPLAEQQNDSVIHARQLRFERFFSLVLNWDEAEREAKEEEGSQNTLTPSHLQRVVRLSADEDTSVLQIALKWREDIQTSARDALKVVAAVRAANPGVHMDRTNSPEIRATFERRWRIADDAIDELMGVLGTKSFSKVDKFTNHMESYEKPFQ